MDETTATTDTGELHHTGVDPIRLIVFGLLSVGFFIWVAFGQIEARVWVSGQLTLLDRRISSMWQYLGSNLPELPAAGMFGILYWLAIAFMVTGTIVGLWLILCTPDDDVHQEALEDIHAAHLHHDLD